MDKSIKISIIIPMYNVENYIAECLDSILNQNIKEIEVIIIDDGSTDNSNNIAQEYCDKYPFFIMYKQKNSGQSIARNLGIKKARGEYLFFLDSDDYIEKNSLENIYNICKENDLDILKTEWTTLFESTGQRVVNKSPLTNIHYKAITTRHYYEECIYRWYNVIPWNGLIRREFLISNKIEFPERIQFEDNTFTLWLLLKNFYGRIMQVDIPFYNVRIRGGSTTSEIVGPKKIYDILENINLMNKFINSSAWNGNTKELAKVSVSILTFHLTTYFYRLDPYERKKVKKMISKRVLIESIKYSCNRFQKIKLFAFLYTPFLLDIFYLMKKIKVKRIF